MGTLFVSPDGNDSWNGQTAQGYSGGTNGPLASLAGAQKRIRELRRSDWLRKHYTVIVKGGEYILAAPLNFTTDDSNVTYRAAKNEHPIIIGGSWLKPGELHRASEPTRIPIPKEIRQLLTEKSESRDTRGFDPRSFELFSGGTRLPVARWPNSLGLPGAEPVWAYVSAAGDKPHHSFRSNGIPSWLSVDSELGSVYIFSQSQWFDEIVGISQANPGTGEIQLSRRAGHAIAPGARFFVLGHPSALDSPGEWYLDRGTGEIVLIPRAGDEGRYLMSRVLHFAALHGTTQFHLQGLKWIGCRSDGFWIENVRNCSIERCTIELTGGWGIVADTTGLLELRGNFIGQTGLGGIRVSSGSRNTLAAGKVRVHDNEITRFGERLKCYQPGIFLTGVGAVISQNRIHDGPHAGVIFSGNDHVISGNSISNVCRETTDAGAIYSGRDWSSRGTIITQNRIYNIIGSALSAAPQSSGTTYTSPGIVSGIYLDDLLEETTITENSIFDCGWFGVHLGGGGNHTISRNRFARLPGGIYISERTINMDIYEQVKLSALRYAGRGSPYHERYPKMAMRMEDQDLTPRGITVANNLFHGVETTYVFEALSVHNAFKSNTFMGKLPQVKAVVRTNHAQTTILNWRDWKQLGFDIDSRILENSQSTGIESK